MKIEKDSIITLEDGDKYSVVKVVESKGETFAYIININNQDDDGFVMINGDTLTVINNIELLKELTTLI